MPVATGKDVPTRPAGCFDTRRLRVHVLTLAPTDHNTQRMVFLGCRTDEDRPMVCCHAMVMPPIPDLRTAPYLDWIEAVAVAAERVLKDDGSFFLNVGGRPSDLWIPFDVIQRFRPYYHLQNVIHWVKSIAIEKEAVGDYERITGDIAVGHYQPVNSPRYLSQCHEHIFHFTKRGDVRLEKLDIGVPYQDKSNIGRWKAASRDLRDRGNTWFIPYRTIRSSRPHPTSFPEKLPEMCIRLHGFSEETLVLDPFMGIGSTACACTALGVRYIGFEIDEEYAAIARTRIAEIR